MSQIQALNSFNQPREPQSNESALNDLDLDTFLDLMIAELQNQDPLNPLENDQLLAQISQIREVGATDRLTSTLDAVLLGQNVSSATNLIGADVVALTDEGERINGNVRKVTIDGGIPKLDVALEMETRGSTLEGAVPEGQYAYEVVWNNEDGERFSVQLEANTANFTGYEGAIDLTNLPDTVPYEKAVYRTDATGSGEKRLVATLPGKTTSFTDTTAPADLGRQLTGVRQALVYARKESVTLNNIAEITPPN